MKRRTFFMKRRTFFMKRRTFFMKRRTFFMKRRTFFMKRRTFIYNKEEISPKARNDLRKCDFKEVIDNQRIIIFEGRKRYVY